MSPATRKQSQRPVEKRNFPSSVTPHPLISMKYGLYNLGNSKSQSMNFFCYGLIIYNGLFFKFTILGHSIVPRVMTFRNNVFGKYEICDGLCNFLLCVIKVRNTSKDVFHEQC
jgi:hypothetical protein